MRPKRGDGRRRILGLVGLFTLPILLVAGCASTPKPEVPKDKRLSRHVTDGRQAFEEGQVDQAERKYRDALHRAWAIDDPYESGTVAYNLAACLTSQGLYNEAADLLVDARVELCRAGASTGNTWLLSAEIAMVEKRFDDAERFVDYAASTCPPCEMVDTCCLCGPSGECCPDACRECCIVRLPCIGKDLKQEQERQQCEQGYRARVELARARLAAKQWRISEAKQHLAAACRLSTETCDFSLHADRHDVAALVHDLEADFLQAGAHRDREAQLLRCIGHYREIPNVLDDAAESYRNAERIDLAVDRMIRSARIRFARGQWDEAWERVRRASEWRMPANCRAVEIRLSLTAKAIRDALDNQETQVRKADAEMPDKHLPEPNESLPKESLPKESLMPESLPDESNPIEPPEVEPSVGDLLELTPADDAAAP